MHRSKLSPALALVVLYSCSPPPVEPLMPQDAGVMAPEDAGSGDAGEVPDAGEPFDAGLPAPAIRWVDCPLHSEGGSPVRAECATVPMPLRAGQDGGPTIDVFVKRWAADAGTRERQVWMLMGGPGGSGMGYENVAEQIGGKFTDLEFYIPDHRGTGRSSRLGCLEEAAVTEGGMFITQGEWPGCLDGVRQTYGDDLGAYATTNAANDLGLLIEKAKSPSQKVFVYGASYGTYWAHRYLQLYPRQADGVVLDSMVPSPGSLAEQDEDANEAGKLFFDGPCKSDAKCSQKLGADPWATANATLQKLKTGHCGSFAAPYGQPAHVLLRRAFGQMMMGFALRPYIAAALYRADRCSAADEQALARMMTVFYGPLTAASTTLYKLWGWVLSNNILFSELWPAVSPTAADLRAIREASVVSRDVTSAMDVLVGTWPTYPKDAYVGQWAQTDTPMLMLAGGLDPATLMRKALEVKPHFQGAHQTWVEFPLGAHGILSSSPTNAGPSCGTAIMVSFMRSPMSPPDRTCMSDLRGLDFTGAATPATTMQLFGVADPWD